MNKVEEFVLGPGKFKYTAIMKDGKRVNFGHRDYEQFRDSVPKRLGGGQWASYDHGDATRRRSYRCRHSKIINRRYGTPAYKVKYSPSWFSYYYLW
jgi:hypothetical protein